jgi:predicted MFS family arabinose efflux permease
MAPVRSPRLAASIVLISISGNLLASLVPLAVGELIEPLARGGAGLSLQFAGGMETAELVAIAAGSTLSPAIKARGLALKALLIALALSAACLPVRGPELFALRTLIGLAVGVALGAAVARISETRDPERVYTWATAANGFAASLSLTLGGTIALTFGLSGMFLLIGATVLPGIVGALMLGEAPTVPAEPRAYRAKLSPSAQCMTAALFLLNLAYSAAFSVLGPGAHEIGLDKAALGLALGIGPLAGLTAVLATGYLLPQAWRAAAASTLLVAIGALLLPLLTPSSPVLLACAIVLTSACYYAAIPPVMALGTTAGPAERAAPIMSGAIVLGAALGPGLGGTFHGGGALVAILGPVMALAVVVTVLGSKPFWFQKQKAS